MKRKTLVEIKNGGCSLTMAELIEFFKMDVAETISAVETFMHENGSHFSDKKYLGFFILDNHFIEYNIDNEWFVEKREEDEVVNVARSITDDYFSESFELVSNKT